MLEQEGYYGYSDTMDSINKRLDDYKVYFEHLETRIQELEYNQRGAINELINLRKKIDKVCSFIHNMTFWKFIKFFILNKRDGLLYQ